MAAAAPCARLDGPLPAPWRELSEAYGVEAPAGADAAARLWPNNGIALDAVAFACGRVARGDDAGGDHAHDAHELARCRALAARAQTLLAGTVVGRGDESDHAWLAFCAPALLGDDEAPAAAEAAAAAAAADAAVAAAENGAGAAANASDAALLVSEAELRRACGGALCATLRFERAALPQAAEQHARRLAEEAEHDGGGGGHANAAAAFCSLARLLACDEGGGEGEAAGLQRGSATFFRAHDRAGSGCVYPHFAVARTAAGSVVGVVGATVWT